MKVGLVGCGHISTSHLKAWAKVSGFEVHAVFDLNRDFVEKQAKKFNVPVKADSLEQVIDCCDVIDVCTPPASHAPISLQVMEAGKHLIIEKPLVTDLADWEKMKAALAQSSTRLAVIHNIKFAASVQKAHQLISEGRIGKLVRLERQFLTHPSRDRMLIADNHWSHSLPGGRWFETLPHELYLSHYFLGGSVQFDHATAVKTASAPSGAPADEVTLTFKSDEAIALMQYSANCEQNVRTLTLRGSEGQIQLDLLADNLSMTTLKEAQKIRPVGFENIARAQFLAQAVPDRAGYLKRRVIGDTPHSRVIAQFADYVMDRGPAPTPLEEVEFVVRQSHVVGKAIEAAVS